MSSNTRHKLVGKTEGEPQHLIKQNRSAACHVAKNNGQIHLDPPPIYYLLFIYFPLGAWVSPGLNNALSSHEETERERERERRKSRFKQEGEVRISPISPKGKTQQKHLSYPFFSLKSYLISPDFPCSPLTRHQWIFLIYIASLLSLPLLYTLPFLGFL